MKKHLPRVSLILLVTIFISLPNGALAQNSESRPTAQLGRSDAPSTFDARTGPSASTYGEHTFQPKYGPGPYHIDAETPVPPHKWPPEDVCSALTDPIARVKAGCQ
jgi:hypothetical protein